MAIETRRRYSATEAAANIRNADRAAGRAMMAERARFLASPEGIASERFALDAQRRFFAANGKAMGEGVRNGAIASADSKDAGEAQIQAHQPGTNGSVTA